MTYQPKTGEPCHCKRGVRRDNCPACEGTGQRIDFAAIRARKPSQPVCPNCGQWQYAGRNGYPDCLHECALRGFAARGTS